MSSFISYQITEKGVRIITFSYYFKHSAPLFKQLYILNFKALFTQRIYVIMFKIHITIIIQDKKYLYRQIRKNENSYKVFSFYGISIWDHISKKIPFDMSYACFLNGV